MKALVGLPSRLLRNEEGPAGERLSIGTHATTHLDAPWHYNSTIGGRPAETIDELPLERFFGPGVVVDARHKAGRRRGHARRDGGRIASAGHRLSAGDIVLVHSGRDAFYDDPSYMLRGPGVSAEATRWLFDAGVRVMGIDAWGWDAPLDRQAKRGDRARRARRVLGGPPVRSPLLADRAPDQPRRPAANRLLGRLLPAQDQGRQRRAGPRCGAGGLP